jgi:NAD(P)-dependent dehydrogenase (short-subunit alcohol dehydrogenase family)
VTGRSGILDERVAIVTGGTQGIGEAVVRRFVAEGASVVVVARTGTKAEALAQELGPHRVLDTAGDVSDAETAVRVVGATVERFGRLDILVNNAAIDYSGVELVDSSEEDIRRVFEVNTIGAIFMLQEAARHMQDHKGGAIVNVISRAGLVGIPGMSVYGASKGALASLTRTAAVELAPFGIRVNSVAPGATETPMMRTWIEDQPDPASFERGIVAGLLGNRLAHPEEVSEAILFLASPTSSYVTGVCLPVDGGFTAR